MNQLLTHESKSIDTAMQSLKKANNWLSSFIESYSPPLDGERYLTDKELSEFLKLSRRTLQEYRKQGILPYIILCGKTLYPESEIQALLTGNYRKPIIDGTVSQGEGTASYWRNKNSVQGTTTKIVPSVRYYIIKV